MNGPPRLSALVLTRDERHNIDRCLGSLAFCDEIVVLDSGSTDGTVEAARAYTAKVLVEEWRGFGRQRQRALELCRGDWVLWVDADEAVSEDLRRSILEVVDSSGGPAGPAGYRVSRQVFYLGRWIRRGGWGNDRVLRLVRRKQARFTDEAVHEGAEVDGPVEDLSGRLEHYSYRDLAHHWSKIEAWSSLWARQARERGRRARWTDLAFRPAFRFARIYFLKLGLLEGWRGLVMAGMAAAYVFMKYARLKEEEIR